MSPAQPKTFHYAVELDRGGRLSVAGGASIEQLEGWSPDHLLLAALTRCSIESLGYHARRAGHELQASGFAEGTVTRRHGDGRYAFVEINCRIDAQLTPRTNEVDDLLAKAERDCFVSASLTIEPTFEWRIA